MKSNYFKKNIPPSPKGLNFNNLQWNWRDTDSYAKNM